MESKNLKIAHTTRNDMGVVDFLFAEAMGLQGKNGYKVWKAIDRDSILKDIEQKCQYKVQLGAGIVCIFSVLHADPLIWRDRDQGNAVYLHRIVAHPNFKGLRLFENILAWTRQYAKKKNIQFIRMDTLADNKKMIAYYQTYGFEIIEYYTTPNTPQLPIQNRNLEVALLELKSELG
jgi:ribosomal protein S18 acetylase RimI-like enzyme